MGRKLTAETRLKISQAHKGRKFSDAHRAKLRAAKLGKVSLNIVDGSLAAINRERTYPVFTPEWIARLSASHKGQTPKTAFKIGNVAWNKGKRFPELSGPNSPAWKGGATEAGKLIRNSADYRDWRTAVFQRDNYTCVDCGDDRGGNLEADHIKPFSLFPALRLDVSNGRTLCQDCHRKTETYGSKIMKYAI